MSPERKEPESTGQHPNEQDGDDSFDEEVHPLPEEDEENPANASLGVTPARESEEPAPTVFADPRTMLAADDTQSFWTKFEVWRHLGFQLSPFLVPLLFASLTLLCVLPFVFKGRLDRLLSVALVLLALAVLQGMMLYYANSNTVYWSLGIAGGFCLFLLAACFVVFGPGATIFLLLILLIIAALLARSYMRPVPEGTVAIVYSSGKYNRTLLPGLNFLLPWESIASRVYTREVQWTCREQTIPISDDEVVHLKATISYQLLPEDAYVAVTQVTQWENRLHLLVEATLQALIPEMKLSSEDLLAQMSGSRFQSGTSERFQQEAESKLYWKPINSLLSRRIQDHAALWGVQINWVEIRDVRLASHAPTPLDAESMNPTRPLSMGTIHGAPHAQGQQVQSQAPYNRERADTTIRMQMPQHSPMPGTSHGSYEPHSPSSSGGTATTRGPLKEQTLIDAYRQVQNNSITNPQTIRHIAARFQAIAQDPQASRSFSFDAARSAQKLYERAQLYEEKARMRPQDSFETTTSVDRPMRRTSDDNRTSGG